MKLTDECYDCLKRLIVNAAELATDNRSLRIDVKNAGLKILDSTFSRDRVSIVVATKIHDEIKKVSGNYDPYRSIKDSEIKLAREMLQKVRVHYDNIFSDLLKLAVLGNSMDFFRPLESVAERDVLGKIEFYIDDSEVFRLKLSEAKNVLYLADNAGEVYFDIPLLKHIQQITRVKYVVKAHPVQNDITFDEIVRAGVKDDIIEIIDTGTATPGIDFAQASREFINEFENADLVVAKGMGYYESLSELSQSGRFFYCFKAKCLPVAKSVGVPLDSYIAMLR